MIICKNLDKNKAITNIDEWKDVFEKKQWKDGRSAKELAKAWINDKGKYLETLIDSKDEFEGIKFLIGSPEYESKFDGYRGRGRYHDLLVMAEDKKGDILISVEAKVDEKFGRIIKEYYLTKVSERIEGSSTKAPDRIEDLLANIFKGEVNKGAFDLRYQLLHAIAGTVAEANKRNISRAIFVVRTFRPRDGESFNSNAYERNIKDLNHFVKYLSSGDIKNIENNSLIGPFNTKTNDYLSEKVNLYIMKVESLI